MVSREEKRATLERVAANCEYVAGLHSNPNLADDKNNDARLLRAILADYEEPKLPEGWAVDQGPGLLGPESHHVVLESDSNGEAFWQASGKSLVRIGSNVSAPLKAARAWHLACIAAIDEREGGDA